MLNQIVLVGRIVSIVMQDADKGNRGVVTISVPQVLKMKTENIQSIRLT